MDFFQGKAPIFTVIDNFTLFCNFEQISLVLDLDPHLGNYSKPTKYDIALSLDRLKRRSQSSLKLE